MKSNKIFQKPYSFAIFYSIFLIIITVYFLLKTFVIEETYEVVTETQINDDLIKQPIEKEITDSSYKDENLDISLETIRKYDTDIYVVKVKTDDVNLLKTAFAKDSFGKNIKETTSTISENNDAILAINGDYYGFRNSGYVIRNGILYRDTSRGNNVQDLVIYNDGSFEIINEGDISAEELLDYGAEQVFSFGPGLIQDGEIIVDKDSEILEHSSSSNPRTAVGMIEPGEYIFFVSDGRTTESEGLSLLEIAEIMKSYGVTEAYNLDGGGSSTLVFNGKVINNPTSGHSIKEREVSDILYIGYE